jgi:Ca2+-binding EF-hand superfamily protein
MRRRLAVIAVVLAFACAPCWTAAGGTKPKAAHAPAAAVNDVQDIIYFGAGRPVLLRVHIRIDGKPFEAAWEGYLRELFRYVDADGDGTLSPKEARHLPSAEHLVQSLQNGGFFNVSLTANAASFIALDKNKDGKVTLDELLDYYRRSGAGPFQLSPVHIKVPAPNPVSDALFKRLDTNKDGKLSKEELANAAEVLRKLDVNDDELISAQEIVPALRDPFGFGNQFLTSVPGGAAMDKATFYPVNQAERKRLAQVLWSRYGPAAKPKKLASKAQSEAVRAVGDFLGSLNLPGKDKNVKLTRKQLGLDKATFELLDANKDGVLDASELERFCQRPADLELTVRVGEAGDRQVEPVRRNGRVAGLASEVVAAGSGGVVATLGDVQIHLSGGGDSAYDEFFKAQEEGIRQFFVAQYRAADTKKKGYIVRKDLKGPQAQFIAALFDLADRDGDGKLTEKEFTTYLDLQSRAARCFTQLVIADLGHGLFEVLDANGDGFLGPQELRTAWARLSAWDRNNDGFITVDEIPQQFQLTLSRGRASFGVRFGALGGYSSAPSHAVPSKGPLWFRKMDRNGDGYVSRREWLGSTEDFKRIDTDGDGLIDVREAERAETWLKQRAGKGR